MENINIELLGVLNKHLGDYITHNKRDYLFYCPFCKHYKHKLTINLEYNKDGLNKYQCWVCGEKGVSIVKLFKKIGKYSSAKLDLDGVVDKKIYKYNDNKIIENQINLPEEYIKLTNKNIESAKYFNYLCKRGISKEDIIKYNIGYCHSGKYKDCLIFPSYSNDYKLNYYLARNINPNKNVSYILCEHSKDIIFNEYQINWDLPIVICEGVFDAISIKRNSIPILGKRILSELRKKILLNGVDKIIISLDNDAIKQSLEICQEFINEGIKVYLVNNLVKDANETGFENYIKILHDIRPLTNNELLKLKIKIS